MIEGLQPYTVMKDSGVPWLGRVPEHWIVAALRHRYSQCLGKMLDSKSLRGEHSVPYLRNIDVQWDRINAHDLPVMDIAPAEYSRYLVQPGDLLVCEGGDVGRAAMWQGRLAVCGYQKALHRLRPLSQQADNPRYMMFALMAAAAAGAFYDGHESTIAHLTGDKLRMHRFPFPQKAEQDNIVQFIDHADRLFRGFIAAKRKLIKLLDEQKQAIIQRAVTRGLDHNVRLKPSGVEWLGDIPEHWRLQKLRHSCAILGGMTPSMAEMTFWDGDIPWVTPKDMKRDFIGDSKLRVTARALDKTSLTIIPSDSVLMVVRGMILARRVPVAVTRVSVTINQDMKALLPRQGVRADFLGRLLSAAQAAFTPLIDESGHGTKRFPTERWRELLFGFPSEEAQSQISQFLNSATADAEHTIDKARRQIEAMTEYRTRLIADVVTGKFDVRAAAAALPESSGEVGARHASPLPDAAEMLEDDPKDAEEVEEIENGEATTEEAA